ncbi:adenosylmethionine--8-amino-7-oxononanoate transaminase [Insolitispirillum peregrinum]|uniref:adenosylmethionine--8-amino-7-oxononanoate transaminase n=1 Tax=Insolitispirillum peregrinum TaxID=80876 RepID=UPI003611181A
MSRLSPAEIIALDRAHVWHPFTQAQTAPDPVVIERGAGVSLFEPDGREWLDLVSSWWVNLHGHGHTGIAEAIAAQARTLEHVIFAQITHRPAAELSARLAAALPAGLERVFFSDNGSTAIEVAMKAALQLHRNQGQNQRQRFLAFDGGYHGDTVGAMSAGVSSGFFNAWTEMLFPVDVLDLPTTWIGDDAVEAKEAAALAALDQHLAACGDQIVAAIIEPLVQGASGMRMHRAGFLKQAAERLRAAGVLVIFDEVMTGFGRTGAVFACQQVGFSPDFLCLSKGLTGGFLPMALTITTPAVYEAFLDPSVEKAFLHGHSYTANPLGCAAALASLDLTLSADCAAQRQRIERHHRAALAELADLPMVCQPRVQGTIAALTIRMPDGPNGKGGYASPLGAQLTASFRQNGLLLRPLGNVVYMLPPYCISDEQLERGWQGIRRALLALR